MTTPIPNAVENYLAVEQHRDGASASQRYHESGRASSSSLPTGSLVGSNEIYTNPVLQHFLSICGSNRLLRTLSLSTPIVKDGVGDFGSSPTIAAS